MRLFLAVLLAPPLATIPGMILGTIMRGWVPKLSDLPLVVVLYVPFGYVGALLLGLPIHMLLRRRGWTNWPTYAVLGSVIASLVAAVPALTGGLEPVATDWIAVVATGALAGLIFRGFVGPQSNLGMQRAVPRPVAGPDR